MKVLFTSSVSACFELDRGGAYYAEEAHEVCLNGERHGDIRNTNVFSLFGLLPSTEYTVEAAGESITFCTLAESACLDAKKNGAAADGIREDTALLQSLINACPEGGRVTLPQGDYLVGPLWLKSHMTLELQRGARLLGVLDVNAYRTLPAVILDDAGRETVFSTWEGEEFSSRESLINAYRAENLCIVGEGILDGNAQNSTWWTVEAPERKIGRARLCFLNACRGVSLHGITGKNSPSWTFHPFYSEDISLLDISVESPKTSPNTDGIDPEGCSGVRIIGCRISTGDDCIAIKSGKRQMAEKHRRAAEHYTIRNCLMQFGHGAVVFGSEMSGGIRDVQVSRCYFRNTDRGLRIKTRRGRGKLAVVDGITFSDIVMDGVLMPLVINMYYNCDPLDGRSEYVWSRKPHPIGDDTPYLGAFTFRNILCRNCECVAGFFDGLPEQPIKSVRIENASFSFREEARRLWPASQTYSRGFCREGLYFDNVESISLQNVSFENVIGDEVQLGSHRHFERS